MISLQSVFRPKVLELAMAGVVAIVLASPGFAEPQSSTKPAAGASSGAAAGAGACEAGDPAFTIEVTFAPLPSSAEIGTAAKLTSNGAAR